MATQAPTLYLIDGHAQLYRAYHTPAFANRRASDGTPTGAIYGFFTQLRAVRSRFKPDHLGCVFDPQGPVFREKEFAGYKSQRAPMPSDLRQQIGPALELCAGYGIPAIQVEEYEADDVLGTLAKQAVARGFKTVIVTGDKDLLQLVDDDIGVYDPMKEILYDAEKVVELKGLKPTQIVDWLGLMGDHVDNIPGVTGVGDLTAVKLLTTHGTLEQVLEYHQQKFKERTVEIEAFYQQHRTECDKPKESRTPVKPPKGMKVVEAYLFMEKGQACASHELARIRTDAPVTFNPDDFVEHAPDRAKLIPLLSKLDFRQFLRDLGGAQEDLLTVSEQKTHEAAATRDYRTVDSEDKFTAFAQEFVRQKRFAIDTETTGLRATEARLVGLSFSWEKGVAWYVPVRGPLGEAVLDEQRVLNALRGPLEDAQVEKVGQNAKYDRNVLRRHGVELRGLAFDTLLAGWLLDPGALRHDLDTLAFDHLGIRKIATHTLIGKGKPESMDLVPVADVARYACEDADVTWQLADTLLPKLASAGLTKLMQEIETPLVEVLAEMEWTGIKVDCDLLRKMSDTLGQQLAAQEEEIHKLAGARFTINSPKQLGAILFEKMGLSSKIKTATGKASTGEDVLLQLAAQGHELPRLILEYRQFSKLKNTYVDLLPTMVSSRTGRIHASFNQTGAETGRLSSNDPNLQNIPVRSALGRSIRAAFKSGEQGWKVLGADYSQIELRILAHYSEDAVLLQAFAQNKDIHVEVAAQVFGVKESDVTQEQRSKAKTVNFGILYGQTAFGLAQTLGLSQREAQEIIDRFFNAHPHVRECLDRIIAEAHQKGCVTTILGRRRFIPQLKEQAQQRLGERIAVNTVFQGSAADLIKKAMLDIHRELRGNGSNWKARLLLQIHDELLFECPLDEVPELTRMVKDKMEQALPLRVPLHVEIGVGDDWLSAKD